VKSAGGPPRKTVPLKGLGLQLPARFMDFKASTSLKNAPSLGAPPASDGYSTRHQLAVLHGSCLVSEEGQKIRGGSKSRMCVTFSSCHEELDCPQEISFGTLYRGLVDEEYLCN
jgi:hypothetical protein